MRSAAITFSRLPEFTIGELSSRTGVIVESIRYYENIGFMPKPRRSANGRRSYDAESTKRLRFIKRSKDMGFSQDEVRNLLRLADGGVGSCGAVQKLATTHLKDVQAKISDLLKLEKILSETLNRCLGEGSTACAVLDVLSD